MYIDGSGKLKAARHAVIENKLNQTALTEQNNSVLERNRALLQYIATLADSNSKNDLFNYEFVESIIKGGADINITDEHGQSMFHEVARSWNVDVAKFIITMGEYTIIEKKIKNYPFGSIHHFFLNLRFTEIRRT